jgi:hypothetical protein
MKNFSELLCEFDSGAGCSKKSVTHTNPESAIEIHDVESRTATASMIEHWLKEQQTTTTTNNNNKQQQQTTDRH